MEDHNDMRSTLDPTAFDREQAELRGLSEYQRAVYRRMRNHGYTHAEARREAERSS
jgi:hypothetical protein